MSTPVSHFRAIGFALAGFTAWVVGDAFMKAASKDGVPPHQIAAMLGLFMCSAMLIHAMARKNIRRLWPKHTPSQFARNLLSFGCNVFNAIALKHLTLALFFLTVFTAPMLIALLAAFFLKEHLDWKKTAAIFAGFVGVLVGVNPFGDQSNGDWIGFLAATMTALCFAIYIVWSRVKTQTETTESLVFCSGLVSAAVGLIWMLFDASPMSPRVMLFLCGLGAFCLIGSICNFIALRHTTAANVGQIHYTQIITGAIIGYIIWGETLTAHMVGGAALIIGSGLYIAHQAQKSGKSVEFLPDSI